MGTPIPAVLWTYRARLDRIIDADTVALEIDLGFGVVKAGADNHVRVKSVNAPELHGATREAGLAAKTYAEIWFAGLPGDWPLIIQTERGKDQETRTFERWVAQIFRISDGHSLADDLLASGHAVRMES